MVLSEVHQRELAQRSILHLRIGSIDFTNIPTIVGDNTTAPIPKPAFFPVTPTSYLKFVCALREHFPQYQELEIEVHTRYKLDTSKINAEYLLPLAQLRGASCASFPDIDPAKNTFIKALVEKMIYKPTTLYDYQNDLLGFREQGNRLCGSGNHDLARLCYQLGSNYLADIQQTAGDNGWNMSGPAGAGIFSIKMDILNDFMQTCNIEAELAIRGVKSPISTPYAIQDRISSAFMISERARFCGGISNAQRAKKHFLRGAAYQNMSDFMSVPVYADWTKSHIGRWEKWEGLFGSPDSCLRSAATEYYHGWLADETGPTGISSLDAYKRLKESLALANDPAAPSEHHADETFSVIRVASEEHLQSIDEKLGLDWDVARGGGFLRFLA